MRARNIKPGFFKNEDLACLSTVARLFFVGLWLCADRGGKLENRPRKLKAEILPYESRRVEPLIKELEKGGFIHCYQADGQSFIQILNFSKHQRPHKNEPSSVIPCPKDFDQCTNDSEHVPTMSEGLRSDSLIPDSLIPDTGLLEGGSVVEVSPTSPPQPAHEAAAATDLVLTPAEAAIAEAFDAIPGAEYQRANLPAKCREWREAAPCVDLVHEARKYRDWCQGQPRKKRNPISGFNNWVDRAKGRELVDGYRIDPREKYAGDPI